MSFFNVLNSCSIEVFSFQQWIEYLFVPLKDVKDLRDGIEEIKSITTRSLCQSKMIRFSQTRKHSELHVSVDGMRVDYGSGNRVCRNILGEDPLLPGNVYTWKLRYQGITRSLVVGVIDESKFNANGGAGNAQCFSNGNNV
ncbi:hypothetical protein GEMRC1_000935 [Eukaryota sp. GEM-RC1]